MRANVNRRLIFVLGCAIAMASAARACSLCSGSAANRSSLREDLGSARLVLYGTLANPRIGADGNGSTDLRVETVLKNDPAFAKRQVLTIGRFVPVDAKSPPKFLVFCDVVNGTIDAYRGNPVKSATMIEYVRGLSALPADRSQQLLYCFRFLDHADAEISADAYLEFAKTGDADVARVARRLDPSKLRKMLADPATPQERLGLFAYLLGASGGSGDAAFLVQLINDRSERLKSAFGGALAGLVQLEPTAGWAHVHAVLKDAQRPFGQRLAALGTLRFFHAAHGDATKPQVLLGLTELLPQGDLGDVAIEDLRRFHWWDRTHDVLALYGRPSHSAPLMKRAIVRYALSCPDAEAKAFIDRARSTEKDMVRDVEEGLQFEQPITNKSSSR